MGRIAARVSAINASKVPNLVSLIHRVHGSGDTRLSDGDRLRIVARGFGGLDASVGEHGPEGDQREGREAGEPEHRLDAPSLAE
jgi:hypothetical protein